MLITLFEGTCSFFQEIIDKRYALYQLIKRDLTDRYLATYLGLFWPFLQQFIMVFVMGFVLQKGLKASPSAGIPFVAWVIPAQAAWSFLSEAMAASTGAILSYSYLVKKINFKVSLLPLIKICSAVIIQLIFLFIVVLILLTNKIWPSWYWLQVFYYLFSSICLLLGVGWFLSALTVFVRDISHGLGMALNFLMWLTPIYWNINNLDGWMKYISYINPLSYITEGYRRSFLYNIPFWQDPWWTVYYWIVVAVMMGFGILVFRKLKPHFADVL